MLHCSRSASQSWKLWGSGSLTRSQSERWRRKFELGFRGFLGFTGFFQRKASHLFQANEGKLKILAIPKIPVQKTPGFRFRRRFELRFWGFFGIAGFSPVAIPPETQW
jgi:hypothetical protein